MKLSAVKSNHSKNRSLFENQRLFFWQTCSRLYTNFINWSSSCESSAFHLPPSKPSGHCRLRRWHPGSPESGTRSVKVRFPFSNGARHGLHLLVFCLAPPRQVMTLFSTSLLKWPIDPTFRDHRKKSAACCASCVNPMRPSGPIARDAW